MAQTPNYEICQMLQKSKKVHQTQPKQSFRNPESFSRNFTVWTFALLLTHPQNLQSVRLAMDLEKVKISKSKFYSIIHLFSSVIAQLYEHYLQMQTTRVQQSSMQSYLEYRSPGKKVFFAHFLPPPPFARAPFLIQLYDCWVHCILVRKKKPLSSNSIKA